MNNNTDNTPILGFWDFSDGFMIGEYFPKGGCTAEFKEISTKNPISFSWWDEWRNVEYILWVIIGNLKTDINTYCNIILYLFVNTERNY